MLSIGKLATDRAKYYLDQAEGRVDVVESVGGGLKDYYTGGSAARGEWLGRGGMALRLRGPVDADQLWAVLSGLNPATGVPPRGF